jgi:hypothetical protein
VGEGKCDLNFFGNSKWENVGTPGLWWVVGKLWTLMAKDG